MATTTTNSSAAMLTGSHVEASESNGSSPPPGERRKSSRGATAVAQLARAVQRARRAIATGDIEAIVSAETQLNRIYPWADRAMRRGESGLSESTKAAFRKHVREVIRDLWDAHDRAVAEAVPNELAAAAQAKADAESEGR